MNSKGQQFKSADAKDIALFPQQNDVRNTLDLSGIWRFKTDSLGLGEEEKWFNGLKDSRSIAVPGSWNEQYDDIRDYLALAWYEKETYIPAGWKGQRILIRVGSANFDFFPYAGLNRAVWLYTLIMFEHNKVNNEKDLIFTDRGYVPRFDGGTE
jgi:hypothetical protein